MFAGLRPGCCGDSMSFVNEFPTTLTHHIIATNGGSQTSDENESPEANMNYHELATNWFINYLLAASGELASFELEHGLDRSNGCAREYSLMFLLWNTNYSNYTNYFGATDWTDKQCLQDFVLVAVLIQCLM